MIYFKYCGWAWTVLAPSAERNRVGAAAWIASLAALAPVYFVCMEAAARVGNPHVLLAGGWAASMFTAYFLDPKVFPAGVLAGMRNQIYSCAVAYIPLVAAASLLPCAAFQALVARGAGAPGLFHLFGLEWGVACSVIVVELLWNAARKL